MAKSLFITEKPSVAKEFAKILNVNGNFGAGYVENTDNVVTWCVGHLVSMSYPEAYDETLKKWSLATLPFLPQDYKYEVIPSVEKQFNIVKNQLLRDDVDTIYVCTDSGREGEYIYRLVDNMLNIQNKNKKRVWIDSQTEEEIQRGIREAKDLSEYDSLSDSAYLRAKEDYLIGINFSRILTLLYSRAVGIFSGAERVVIAVGRVMTCVLGMIVDREREIRNFKKKEFFKIEGQFGENGELHGEWKVTEESKYFNSPKLYNENGFNKEEDAKQFIEELKDCKTAKIVELQRKKQKENPPLLFNLAELQNEASKRFKISPDETLELVQSLYEKKMVTYPRTDARVLSTAIAKEIKKNIDKLTRLRNNEAVRGIAQKIIDEKYNLNLIKTKYVDDSKITDHYAIIPTGEENNNLKGLEAQMYEVIARRFLAVFYPPAVFDKLSIVTKVEKESFFSSAKVCSEIGYLEVLKPEKSKEEGGSLQNLNIKKNDELMVNNYEIKRGETSPPNRYTSGSIILAMENAGKLIEDEELREQIKGSGIGTSATRAEIIKKLERIEYINCNKKTQVLTPNVKGELIYEVVKDSIPDMLNPDLTASWEKGLSMVANNEIKAEDFMVKLESYIKQKVKKGIDKRSEINPPRMFMNVPITK